MPLVTKRNSLIYAGLILLAILSILVGNALYLIYKTDSNLIDIYWKQGELVEESIAVSVRQTVESVQLTPRKLKRHFKKTALIIDQIEHSNEEQTERLLLDLIKENSLVAITFFDKNKRFITGFSEKKLPNFQNFQSSNPASFQDTGPGLDDEIMVPLSSNRKAAKPLTLSFERLKEPGWINLTIEPDKLLEIKFKFGLQILIASLENRNLIEYISFYDPNMKIIADSDPANLGRSENRPELIEAFESKVSYFFINNEIMEIIHPWTYKKDVRGVFKIGFPTTEIDRIYSDTLRNTVMFSSAVMLIAIFAVGVVLKLQFNNTEKFEAMQKKIQENEKLVALSNLTAGVAHEVRNPLNSIGITIQRLQYEFPPVDEDESEEYMMLTGLMKKEVDRINQIITDFLGFAKPFEPKGTHFSIDEFLHDCTTLFITEASEKGVKVVLDFPKFDKQHFGDFEKLKQVFINLLRNALDATPSGGEIIVHSELKRDKTWILEVVDNGVGIDKKKLGHVFDIYYTTKENGIGLGLYISRKIINAHSGTIELIPNPNRGITARLRLPKIRA